MSYFRSVSRVFSNFGGAQRLGAPKKVSDTSRALSTSTSHKPSSSVTSSKKSTKSTSLSSSPTPNTATTTASSNFSTSNPRLSKLAITGQVIDHRLFAVTGAMLLYQVRRFFHSPSIVPEIQSETEKLVQLKLTQLQFFFKGIPNSNVIEAHSTSVASNDPIEDRFSVHQYKDKMIFGIYDGHAGWECADTLKNRFHTYLANNLNSLPVPEALSLSFNQFDHDLMKLGTDALEEFKSKNVIPPFSKLMSAISGSVLVTAIVSEGKIHVAHAGDCRAVLGKKSKDGKWHAVSLTEDHDAENPKERDRVLKEHPGEEVIKRKRMLGGLQPFRAMGDARYKWPLELQKWIVDTFSNTNYPYLSIPDQYLTPPYVTANPEVTSVPVTDEDMFLVLATDGLWERATNAQVIDIVKDYMEGASSSSSSSSKWARQDSSASTHLIRNVFGGKDTDAVAALLKIPPPISRMYRDDITITVVFFKPLKTKDEIIYHDVPEAGSTVKTENKLQAKL